MGLKISFVLMFFLVFFSLNFVSAAGSSTRTDFVIDKCAPGCYINNWANFLLSYFCNSNNVTQDVFAVQGACFGVDGVQGTSDDCCPHGYNCNSSVCTRLLYNCDTWTTESCDGYGFGSVCNGKAAGEPSCNVFANTCMWFENKCVDLYEVHCSNYTTSTSCNAAPRGVVLNSMRITGNCQEGYVDSSTGYTVIPGSSRCAWKPASGSTSARCVLNCTLEQTIYSTPNPEVFECPTFISDLTDCIDGVRSLSWTAESTSTVESALCDSGSQEISCGQPVVTVPGFSSINVVLVFLILGMFYIFLHKNRK